MMPDDLELALRWFCRRRPFRSFFIEFHSGGRFLVVHPEAIRREQNVFVARSANGLYEAFGASAVSRLLDKPVNELSANDLSHP